MRAPTVAEVGDSPVPRDIGPITQTDIIRFAGAGGDFNPLHHDPDFAKASGFSGVISMGQMQAAMLAGLLSDWLGVEHLREYEVRFAAPVFLGDVLHLSGEITAIEQQHSTAVATVELSATRGTEAVVRAGARVVVGTE